MIARRNLLNKTCERFLIFVFFLMPLESTLEATLPTNIYNIFKFGPEIVLYFLCTLITLRCALKREKIVFSFIDKIVFLFIIVSSIALFQGSFVYKTDWIIGIRTLFRYYSVYYILNNIQLRILSVEKIKKYVMLFIIFGTAFYILNISFLRLEFGDTYYFIVAKNNAGVFMVMLFSFFLYHEKVINKKNHFILQVIFLLILVSNNSVQNLVAYLMAIVFLNVRKINIAAALKQILKLVIPLTVLILITVQIFLITSQNGLDVSPYSKDISRLWTKSAYGSEVNSNFRLYLLFNVVPKVWDMTNPYLGMGAGTFGSTLSQMRGDSFYYTLGIEKWATTTGDSFVADNGFAMLVAQYGIIGAVIFEILIISIIAFCIKRIKDSQDSNLIFLSKLVFILCTSSFVLNMMSPVFEYRVFAFYLWFFIGLLFNLNSIIKNEKLKMKNGRLGSGMLEIGDGK